MKFSKRVDRFPDEIFASLNKRKIEMEKEGKKIYNLSVGTPDFETAPHIKNALIEAAKEQDNWKYSLRDTPEMLEAVCSYYKRRFDVKITPDMVCSCNGSQEGIGHIGLVLCDEGDTVILPSPCYPVFIAGANMAGAVPFYYPMTKETGYLPRLSDIPDETAKKAVYMIVSLPSNPTGSVATEKVYDDVIDFAKKHDILIIHDNAYSDIIFDGVKGGSFLSHPGAKDVGVEFFSLSKSFNMTGARVSFCIGRKDVIAAFRKLREQIDFGMFYPIQKAAVAALTGPLDMVHRQCDDYEERRNVLCGGLRDIGWNVPDSHGSMFVWAPVPEGFKDSFDFCMELMERTGVICTPGSSFGPLGEGYIRMALVLAPEKIKEAILAIDKSGILKEGR
ncbi:MAG: aminotransferase class I/II-fold pyridoxal phosphate-dependent enzyme [Lachnospiraceae bacterium]|nr:aminotransferase class I/II-fold pyridoxal phosphate-dependent enzyme [Lachnospiraceae bacterium]